MWIMLILASMGSVAGFYALQSQTHEPKVVEMRNADLADNMGVYRASVLAWLKSNPGFSGTSVAAADLAASLPPWYKPDAIWRNHVDANGMVTIYAASLPPMRITTQIFNLSQRSILAGEARLASGTLYSSGFGDTGIPLPSGVVIPDGGPVWMAKRN